MSVFLPILIVLLFFAAIIAFIKSFSPSLLDDLNEGMQDMGESCEPLMCIVLFLVISSGAVFSVADFVLSFDSIFFLITSIAVVVLMLIVALKMKDIVEPESLAEN